MKTLKVVWANNTAKDSINRTPQYGATTAAATKNGILLPGKYIELCVSDTGHGIAKDIMPYNFDPYFTPKVSAKERDSGGR